MLILLMTIEIHAQDSKTNGDEWLNVIDNTCIYDNDTHSAFTSMRKWKGKLYVAFREGESHVAPTDKGKIRVMKNTRRGWVTQHVFSIEGVDLRDPDMLIFNNRLFLYTLDMHYSELTESGWSDFKVVDRDVPGGRSIWKKRIYNNDAYGFGYKWNHWPLFMKSEDGIRWKTIREYRLGGNSNESDMVFVADTMYVCMRVDTPPGSNSLWGKSTYPFTDCDFSVMDISVASPEMIKLTDDLFLLAGREYVCDGITGKCEKFLSIFKVDKNGKVMNRYVVEKNCVDCGYTSFMREKGNVFYMSYYVGDANKSKINVLKFKLN